MISPFGPVFFKMENVIKNFPWGSKTSLQDLFDINNPDNQSQAELWMGAHKNGCSTINLHGEKVLLSDFINIDPEKVLGKKTNFQFGELPYLFKILAAEKALSVQVHPCKKKAEIGFAREEEQGVLSNASNRNYKDDNHKPELVYALTSYSAMNGFREFNEILRAFQDIALKELKDLVVNFSKDQSKNGLKVFFEAILSLNDGVKKSAVNGLIAYAKHNKDTELFALIFDLAEQYPGDIGLFTPLMLNVIKLQPGEAMYLTAETPHAYIKGTALEVMANSDNVLRAGLSPKHVDVKELVANTQFLPVATKDLLLQPDSLKSYLNYSVPIPDFKFSLYQQVTEILIDIDSAEILFSIDDVLIITHQNGMALELKKGESVFVPAYAKEYRVTCNGRFTRIYS